MELDTLINKLNLFYALELNQVALYQAQNRAFQESYYGEAFARIAVIEQEHVDNLADYILKLGGKPSGVGKLLAPQVGNLGGQLVSLAGCRITNS